ncbi:MAG: TauD/TfdA dioxygenase family protein [Acidimicrobiales bacterium]
MTTTTTTIEIVPSGAACGAEVRGVDLGRPQPGSVVFALLQAFREHQVLCVRGQTLTDERLLEVGEWFGSPYTPPEGIPVLGDAGQHGVTRISNVDGGVGGESALPFHSDLQYMPLPLLASMLYAVEVPSEGGATYWSNLYQAYDELSDELKATIADVKGIGFNPYAAGGGQSIAGPNQHTVDHEVPDFPHPIARTHPDTGRTALYMSMFMQRLIDVPDGVDPTELRNTLNHHVDQDHLYYRHDWQPGDLLIWDNRCTNHKRDALEPGLRRVMHRCQIAGTRPF